MDNGKWKPVNKVQKAEPLTEPYGDVIALPIQWNTTPVFKYDPFLGMPLWQEDKIDPEHYIEFIGGEMHRIDKGCCRLCTKKISPYTTKYYQQHYENGSKYCFVYDAEHYYCEDCAKEQASKNYFNDVLPSEVNRFETRRDGETLETVVYADGSRLEELTSHERPQYD